MVKLLLYWKITSIEDQVYAISNLWCIPEDDDLEFLMSEDAKRQTKTKKKRYIMCKIV